MTFFLIATPAVCFGAMIGLLALGLCRAASESGSPDVDPGARPLCAPGSADLSKPAEGVRHGGNQKGRPGRARTTPRPSSFADRRELLELVDERRSRARLYPVGDVQAVSRYGPSTHPDGSTSEWTRTLDVIADLAAPGSDPDAA